MERLDPRNRLLAKSTARLWLRHPREVVELKNSVIGYGPGKDLEALLVTAADWAKPGFAQQKMRTDGRFRTRAVLLVLTPPAVPAMEIVERLPVPAVQRFEFTEEFVMTGMVAPSAFETCISHLSCFRFCFV